MQLLIHGDVIIFHFREVRQVDVLEPAIIYVKLDVDMGRVVARGSDVIAIVSAFVALIAIVSALVAIVSALVVGVAAVVIEVVGAVGTASPLEGPCVHELHEGALAVAVSVHGVEAVCDAVDERRGFVH